MKFIFSVSATLVLLHFLSGHVIASSELVLSDDYRWSVEREMPSSAAQPGMAFEKFVYPEQNAVEWQTRLKRPAGDDSPLYEELKSADFVLQFPTAASSTLHWSKGSHADISDFEPRAQVLEKDAILPFESFGGRSSDGVMPYFNLANQAGGLILAVGWTGDWKASFELLGEGRVRVTAGLKRSRFQLRPGEVVRLPSILIMSYRGDWIAGQNQFRRLMLHHFTPVSAPPMKLMPVAASVHGLLPFNDTSEDNLSKLAEQIARSKLAIDSYWLDAGWNEGGFPLGQGNPNADLKRFPQGLAPVGKTVRRAGLKFIVWFEPERAMRGTWLEREHPDWLLLPSRTPAELRYMENDGFRLVDLGNPQARAWALDTVSTVIREADIGVYRQDFNEYPSYFWHTDEAPDEVGLREVRYVSGLYDFLDGLVLRRPGLVLDNCASGGRRLDFEMMRRSVTLWRSDSCWGDKTFPRNIQAMAYGLSLWLPLHGLGSAATDEVALRSGMGACASFAVNYNDAGAVAALHQHLTRYLKIRPLFAADFYPLTEWSQDSKEWLALQFHDPQTQAGIVLAFCGADVNQRSRMLTLRGISSAMNYNITDWDNPQSSKEVRGLELSETGVEFRAGEGNTAIVLRYGTKP